VLVIRFSAIPSHFSTAVFSTCDVNFWLFVIATFLSLPKQIFLVYLGVLLVQNKSDGWTKTIMFGVVFVITVIMAVWIWFKMRGVKKVLLEEQAARRAAKLKEESATQWTTVMEEPGMESGPRTALLPSNSGRPF
jgi:uncharacterized membrane protein